MQTFTGDREVTYGHLPLSSPISHIDN
jgi:hypothetical protein